MCVGCRKELYPSGYQNTMVGRSSKQTSHYYVDWTVERVSWTATRRSFLRQATSTAGNARLSTSYIQPSHTHRYSSFPLKAPVTQHSALHLTQQTISTVFLSPRSECSQRSEGTKCHNSHASRQFSLASQSSKLFAAPTSTSRSQGQNPSTSVETLWNHPQRL